MTLWGIEDLVEGERTREPARAAGHPRARHTPSRGAPHSQASDCIIRDTHLELCVTRTHYHHAAAVRHARAHGAHNSEGRNPVHFPGAPIS